MGSPVQGCTDGRGGIGRRQQMGTVTWAAARALSQASVSLPLSLSLPPFLSLPQEPPRSSRLLLREAKWQCERQSENKQREKGAKRGMEGRGAVILRKKKQRER